MKFDIIHSALYHLYQLSGIEGFYLKEGPLDGMVELHFPAQKLRLAVVLKKELRSHQFQQLDDICHQYDHFLLVAGSLFTKVKEELRNRGISYLEANGNMHLKANGIFVFIDNQKGIPHYKEKGNRAFTKTGLKVLFHLLQNKDLINMTQRELAAKSGVALGNIPQVLDGLKETGYIVPLNSKTFVWENRKELLDRWITEYASVLRPKLKKERYSYKGQWQDLTFNTISTVWGGEPAADLLTNYLRPEKFLIFTRESRIDLIRKYRLIPDINGELEVLDMFWKQDEGRTAPPMLVYADLLIEGGKRNKETAEKIYYEYIQSNL